MNKMERLLSNKAKPKSTKNFIWIFIFIFEILYLLFWLVNIYRHKLGDFGLPPLSWPDLFFLLLIFFGLVVVYFFLFNYARNHDFSIRHIIYGAVIFSLTLAVIAPLGSGDIYYYIFHERVLVKYQTSPYSADLSHFATDSFYDKVASWGQKYGTTYGPLWLILSGPASLLAGQSEFLNLLTFRLLAILFNLGVIWLIYMILSLVKPQFRLIGTLLYAWNPLVLFEVANNGHNEIMIIFFILLALYFYLNNKKIWVLPCVIAAGLIKYYAIFLAPLFLYYLWRSEQSWKSKVNILLKNFAVSLLLVLVFFMPFWAGWKIFQGALTQANLFMLPSFFPLNILYKFINNFSLDSLNIIKAIGLTLLIIVYVIVLWKREPGEENIVKKIFWLYFTFIFFASIYFQPWYLIGLIPWLILIPEKKYQILNLAFTSFGLLIYSFYH